MAGRNVLAMKKLVAEELSNVDVKRIVRIPSTWGAKVIGEQFEERVGKYLERQSAGKKAKRASVSASSACCCWSWL